MKAAARPNEILLSTFAAANCALVMLQLQERFVKQTDIIS